MLAQIANTGSLLIRSRAVSSAFFCGCTICLAITLYGCGSHRSEGVSFIAVAVGYWCTAINWSVDDAVLFIEIGRELSTIAQSCKRTAYTSSLCLFYIVRKTGSFF